MIPVDWRLEVEWGGAGNGWTRAPDVLVAAGIRARYGIRAGGPTDLVASAGTLQVSFDNSESNSRSTLGLYSRNQPFHQIGFEHGTRMRLWVGPSVRFAGRLDNDAPTLGRWGQRDVPIVVSDWMEEAARWRINGVATLVNTTADAVFNAIVAAIPAQPFSTNVMTGSDPYPYALDTVQNSTGQTELQRLAQSEFGRIYDKGGVVTLENRAYRNEIGPSFLLSAQTGPFVFEANRSYQRRTRVTHAQVKVYPRTADLNTAPVTLFTMSNPLTIAPGVEIPFQANYVDPNQQASRIGGTGIIAPVSGTDYTATSFDGLTDLAGSLGVTLVAGGSSANVKLKNNHATLPMNVKTFKIRGQGLYPYQPITSESIASAADLQRYGENFLTIDAPYQSSGTFGQAAADGLLALQNAPRPYDARLKFCASASQALMNLALQADISTCFDWYDAVDGRSRWFINGVDLEIEEGSILWVTWYLQHTDVSNYFTLDLSQLDSSDGLAAF